MAADGEALSAKCTYCHGAHFETAALGKSAIVQGQSASDIYASLKGYKQGTRNTAGLATIMRRQVSSFSDDDLQAIAEYVASLSASNQSFACENSEISWVAGNRYFVVGGAGDGYPVIVADSQSIQIDRKNKIIKAWTIWLVSDQYKKVWMNKFGYKYNNYGYMKSFLVINYKNMRYQMNTTNYECNGYAIENLPDDTWKKANSGSAIEVVTESIMKKYNLK